MISGDAYGKRFAVITGRLRDSTYVENRRRIARRMSFTTTAAGSSAGPDFRFILAPDGSDETEILPS